MTRPTETPRGARLIRRAAEAAGWTVVETWAHGVTVGREPREVESLALRMRREGRRAVAVWREGKFVDAFIGGASWPVRVNATGLRAALAGGDAPEPAAQPEPTRNAAPGAARPPADELPPGACWGRVHVGDTVRGADMRPWAVAARGAVSRWVVGGDSARFTLRLGGREVGTVRRLADPVDLITRGDHTAIARACEELLRAGIEFDLLEETLTDPFESAKPGIGGEPKHDRFGRYLLPDPETGKEKAWTRVSTIARTLADEFNLTKWKLRQVARGLASRPDLVAGAAAADPERDKGDLDSIAQQAMDAAESKAGANLGTALHTATRRLDAGEPVAGIRLPQPLDRDLAAYASLCKAAGLSPVASERVVVLPELGVAGRFDRIVSQPGGKAKADPMSVLDLKTAKDLSYSWLEIAIQQALYARAPLMWDPATGAYVPKPPVDQTRALVLHLPVGKAAAQLYAVDVAKGWEHAQLALAVRTARSGAKRLAWLVEPDDPATVALRNVSLADSREELAALWERLNKRGLWTADVNAAAMARFEHLQTAGA